MAYRRRAVLRYRQGGNGCILAIRMTVQHISRRNPMTRLILVLTILAMSLAFASPALAMEGEHECMHGDMAMDVASLHHCVDHAVAMGHITNPNWAKSLHAKLDAAQAAVDRGQTETAANILSAFVNEVEAQSGHFIVEPHGEHLVGHAEMVINHLLMEHGM
jgi:hypothetical protein